MTTVPDAARQAAYILEHHGWCRGDFWPGARAGWELTDATPVCVSTALRLAAHPDTEPNLTCGCLPVEEDLGVWLRAMAFVHDLEIVTPHFGVVTYWNDHIAVGPAEVVSVLRRFADDTDDIAELDSREVAA